MFYENELRFLCGVFARWHVRAEVLTREELLAPAPEGDPLFAPEASVRAALRGMAPRTVYKLADSFGRRYLCLLLPCAEEGGVLFIGPYLSDPVSTEQLLMMGERNGIPPKKQKYLDEYFSTIPVLAADCQLMVMFYSFCELLWHSPAFSIVDIVGEAQAPDAPVAEAMPARSTGEVMVDVTAIEKRYAFENEMMQAVSRGQSHVADRLFTSFPQGMFESRVADALRNAKNYAIILNTLLRKAAENGGVHPVHLDRTSSVFAARIENMPSVHQSADLMTEMFRTYCRLVRKHSLRGYSLTVQKTILLIEGDLSADISPASLAAALGISPGYLSTLFRREVGSTVVAYIREKRIEHAAYLLRTTDLQIQTVALYCGIVDTQYFTKLFKRVMGMAPHEYRRSLRHQ